MQQEKVRKLPIRYEVQKFSPAECPKCELRFAMENRDFLVKEGNIIEDFKDVVVCSDCLAEVERTLEELLSESDKGDAEALLLDGYANLKLVRLEISNNSLPCHLKFDHSVYPPRARLVSP